MVSRVSSLSADFRSRNKRLAEEAAKSGIDSVVIMDPSNVYYTSGFRTTLHTRFTAVVIRTRNPIGATLVVPSVDQRLAREDIGFPCLLENCDVYFEGASRESGLPDSPQALLSSFIEPGDRVGVDFENATWGQVEMLRLQFQGAQFVDISDLLHDVRCVKSETELGLMREANRIASAIVSEIPSMLATGLTERALASAMETRAYEHGVDGYAYPTLIGFSPKSLAPHAPPTEQELSKNTIVTVAFGPMISGYNADFVRTYYFGTPPDTVRRRAHQATEVHEAALKTVRAGVEAGQIMRAAHDRIREFFPDLPLVGRADHSLGLTVHETPSLTPDSTTILEKDMVLAVEPGAAPFAMDDIGLFRQCSVVVVTESGYELLSTARLGLVEVAA